MNSDEVPVGQGGRQLPESLNGEDKNWEDLPFAETVHRDYGQEYDSLAAVKNNLGELKKMINNVGPAVNIIVQMHERRRHVDINEDEDETVKNKFSVLKRKRDKLFSALTRFTDTHFGQESEFDKRGIVKKIVEDGSKDTLDSNDKYMKFMMVLRAATKEIFANQNMVMQRMKEHKKTM